MKRCCFGFIIFCAFFYSGDSPLIWAQPPLVEGKDKPADMLPAIEYTGFNNRDPLKSPIKVDVITPEVVEENIVLPEMNLQGILWGKKPAVMIDNRSYRAGESVMEAQIMEITKTGVKLLYKGKEFVLEKKHL